MASISNVENTKSEPVTLEARGIVDELTKCGATHVVWLPDSETNFMYRALQEESRFTLVQVCREGEAMAVCAGLIMGGQRPVTLIQNTGFFESGDSVRGICLGLKLPLLMLIGYRGFKKNAPMKDSAGIFLEPVLKTFGIPYYVLEEPSQLPLIAQAYREAQASPRTVAVLIAGEYRQPKGGN